MDYFYLSETICKCHEWKSLIKKKKTKAPKEGKPIPYPFADLDEDANEDADEAILKIFQIKYDNKLSTTAKFILNSFQNKFIYYAIDDILDILELNQIEKENLLTILYSPIISLQNNFSVNFFDIWIREIYIEEIGKVNRLLQNHSETKEQFSYITIELLYTTRLPFKKLEPLW
jgi:hypothetical protein